MRLLVNLAIALTLARCGRELPPDRSAIRLSRSPERAAGHDRHAARRPRGQLRIPGCLHPDHRRTCGARRAVRNVGGAYAADWAVTRVDPHRSHAARPRVPEQQRLRAGAAGKNGGRGFSSGGLPHGRLRVRVSARSTVWVRSRIRAVRRPLAQGERSAAHALCRAVRRCDNRCRAALAPDTATGNGPVPGAMVSLGALLRSSCAI